MEIANVRFLIWTKYWKTHRDFHEFRKRNISKLSKLNNNFEKQTVIQMEIVKVRFLFWTKYWKRHSNFHEIRKAKYFEIEQNQQLYWKIYSNTNENCQSTLLNLNEMNNYIEQHAVIQMKIVKLRSLIWTKSTIILKNT